MKKILRRATSPLACAFLLLGLIAAVASASDFGPRRRPGHGGGNPIQSVAEPAAITLLGAGLVSLGIYAKKKRGKKQ
jgi:hypothetical protein